MNEQDMDRPSIGRRLGKSIGDTATSIVNGTMDRLQHFSLSAGKKLGIATTAVVVGLTGCAPAETVAPPAAAASETPGEIASSETPEDEFTPGATGKFSPEALSKLSEKELVELFRLTGDSPEELAANNAEILTAYLMSGTTDEELAPYYPLNKDNIERYVNDMDEKYATALSDALVAGEINKDTRTAHEIILYSFATNRLAGSISGEYQKDFQVGKTTIESVEITKGKFDDQTFEMQITRTIDSNYEDSIIGKELGVGDEGHWFASIQNFTQNATITYTVYRSGNHFTVK